MTNGLDAGEKVVDTDVIKRSVIDPFPEPPTNAPTSVFDNSIFWLLGQYIDDMPQWGAQYKARDAKLRAFITEENMFASALSTVASRNASFTWRLNGGKNTLSRYQDVLETANFGKGFQDLIIKTSLDLYTQDAGAFWELVRDVDDPDASVIGINSLDAARCYHTGSPTVPVIYQDRNGKYHKLNWWQVITFAEMPVNIEGLNGLQYCALTRLLRAVQIRKNIMIRDWERTGGRDPNSIIMVKGVTSTQMQDAINMAKLAADAAGRTRYMNPIVVGSLDPKADVGHDKIELASAPEDYDAEIFWKEYIGMIAMAFLTDYQEFSPLPGGNLGTSTQSQILHLKNHGKGPGLFRQMITHAINFRVLPKNCEFTYADPDFEAEKTEAEVKKLRAQTRQIRILSGEITTDVARQIANDEGDLLGKYMSMMAATDMTSNLMVDQDSPAATQLNDDGIIPHSVQPPQQVPITQTGASQGFSQKVRQLLRR